jgi:hypothetical protein
MSQLSSSSKRSALDKAFFPRLLSRERAAAYCGVSVPTFASVCPIKPVALGDGKRLERFDRISLDNWIDSLTTTQQRVGKDWLSELGNT